ncbi:MAG: cupin domain-containing protein [Acetobacteraceae bacterium]
MTFLPYRSSPGEAPILVPAIGLTLRVRLPPETSSGTLTIIETLNAPGFGPPLHRHPETEIFRVMTGRYLYEIDGQRSIAEVGDVVCVPGGAAHGFVNITDAPAEQFILIMPGMDAVAFFTGLGEVMKNGRPDTDALNRFGKLWDVEFLGPPLRAE